MARNRKILRRVPVGGVAILFLVAVLATVMGVVSAATSPRTASRDLASPVMWWLVFANAYFWLRRYERRVVTLLQSDWRRCSSCFYDLRGLPDTGDCPECSKPYDIAQLQAEWQAIAAKDVRRLDPRANRSRPT